MVISANPFIDQTCIHRLSGSQPVPGRYVLYLMQQSQRTRFNHALEYAARQANNIGLSPVKVTLRADIVPRANVCARYPE